MNFTPGIYQHYKGGTYTALFLAFDCNNDRDRDPSVVYVSHTTGIIFTRRLAEWQEDVIHEGIVQRRFLFVRECARPEKRS